MNLRLSANHSLGLVVLTLPAILVPAAAAQVTTRVIALTGDAAPDGNGVFSRFFSPALNDAGQAAFSSFLTGAGNNGIFRSDGASGIVQIARAGDALPDGNGALLGTGFPALNSAGQVAFRAHITATGGGSAEWGIFRSDGASGFVQIAREGDTAPDGNGIFSALGNRGNFSFIDPVLNNAGQAAFTGFLNGTSGGGSDNSGIFRGDGASDLVQIVREGHAAPDGNGVFYSFGDPALNGAGQAAFWGALNGASGGRGDDHGIFRGDGASGLVQIARKGDAVPDGNGTFLLFGRPALNSAGEAAFHAWLIGTNGGFSDNWGIYRGDGASSLVQVARAGDAAPDGNGTLLNLGSPTPLNDAGQAVFTGHLTGTSGGSSDDMGIFRGDGESGLVQIAREGDTAPNGVGAFVRFYEFNLNGAGQVAFIGAVTRPADISTYDRGIYFYDDRLGLTQVSSTGDIFLGSIITDLGFEGHSGFEPDEASGLNNLGQIAYRFTLADGREGIAIATIVPEPSALLLAMLAGSALMLRNRWPLGRLPARISAAAANFLAVIGRALC